MLRVALSACDAPYKNGTLHLWHTGSDVIGTHSNWRETSKSSFYLFFSLLAEIWTLSQMLEREKLPNEKITDSYRYQ